MEQPELGDPVRPDELRKGDLIFIQHHGKEPELGIFLLNSMGRVLFHSFSDPDNRIYDFYFADGMMPVFFRVNPADFTSSQIEAFRESDLFKYLGRPVNNIPYMRQRIGNIFYFETAGIDSLHDFVYARLKSFSMSQNGNYTLTYKDNSGRTITLRGDVGDKPEIYEYTGSHPRRPHTHTANQLLGRVGAATLTRYGPEEGTKIIMEHLPKAALNRRIHLLKFQKNTKNAKRKAESEAAAGGGGGGANNNEANRNNTAKGGRRKNRKTRRRTRRA